MSNPNDSFRSFDTQPMTEDTMTDNANTSLDPLFPTDPTEAPRIETLPTEDGTPLYLYRTAPGVLLVHPDRHGKHYLVYGTGAFLYDFDESRAISLGMTREQLERSALPLWHGEAVAPILETSYPLSAGHPDDDQVVLACQAPHAIFVPAVYTDGELRLLWHQTAQHEALPVLSPVIGWIPAPVALEDLWA